jgi:crossover junction endodeoxyribonuclease RuvC
MTRCGIGVVDGAPGRQLALVDVQVVRTPSGLEVGERLLAVADALSAAIAEFVPDVVAVERVFSQRNVRTVVGTAQVSGLAIVAATRAGVPVSLHTPSEVKAAVTGSGAAGKAQIGAMVTRLLQLPETPRPADAADALALAICQLWRGVAQARLAAAVRTNTTSGYQRAVAASRGAQAHERLREEQGAQ